MYILRNWQFNSEIMKNSYTTINLINVYGPQIRNLQYTLKIKFSIHFLMSMN